MNRKIIIQILLLIILFGIFISVFFLYFNKQENLVSEKNEKINKIAESNIDGETGTLITDLKYTFTDQSGNFYELKSKTGEVDIKNSDKMLMTDVIAFIYLKNSPYIKIVSNYANYNKVSHETNFFESVELTHLTHKANSENLDISFLNNTASMYNNIIYKKPGTQMTADRLEIDLITKNTKMFMNKKYEKIKIIEKN